VGVIPVESGAPNQLRATKEIGRIAVAVFASPDQLTTDGEALAATPRAGLPQFLSMGAPHVGVLRRNPSRWNMEAMRANLRSLWASSGRAEIDVAIAAGEDALVRTALNLVR
jgi:hypothetical protein